MHPLRPLTALIVLAVAAVSGCSEQERITRYRADKPHVVFEANHVPSSRRPGAEPAVPSGPPTDRMLAAFIPYQDQGWFFKLVGSIDAVSAEEQAFRDFIASVAFDEANPDKPSWKLPEKWTSVPGSSMRFATILIDAQPQPLELSVIPLPMPDGPSDDYKLSNINRWRDQMALPSLASAAELDEQTEQFETGGLQATLVDLKGHFKSGAMAGAPFASAGRPPVGPPNAAPPVGEAVAVPFEFKAPAGWSALPAGGIRKAAFNVADKDKQAEITVIDLAASAGDLLPNVNRWRGQIGLGPLSQAELEASVQKIEVGPLKADYVELTSPEDLNPRQTILAAVLVHRDKAWFFKLMGDPDLAAREKDNFTAFVKSVRFDGR